MNQLAAILISLSGAIIFILGALHLVLTFSGVSLHPRDTGLEDQMRVVSPKITNQTSMWRAWIGFNASHSMGALLFGSVYTFLAATESALLFQSWFLLGLGAVFLAMYVFLGARYWFSVPYRGILAATVCYFAGCVVSFL